LDARALPRRAPLAGETILVVEKSSKRFGGLVVVRELSFDMRSGEILGLIGPNGAGKSTVFNLVTGVLPCDGGRITCRGERIDGRAPTAIAGLRGRATLPAANP